MDGSVARMSNADRLRSWLGLPMRDKFVDIGPIEQHAPYTSSQPSLAHPGQWIRRGTRRYTQQGAAFQNSNYIPPMAPAGGAAAAAPEGGALACPSAPTFTSTRWTLVTP
jgi:hypothetical protein